MVCARAVKAQKGNPVNMIFKSSLALAVVVGMVLVRNGPLAAEPSPPAVQTTPSAQPAAATAGAARPRIVQGSSDQNLVDIASRVGQLYCMARPEILLLCNSQSTSPAAKILLQVELLAGTNPQFVDGSVRAPSAGSNARTCDSGGRGGSENRWR
jgi:hypothetical protein